MNEQHNNELNDIKTVLFEQTEYYRKEWLRYKKEFGEWDNMTNIQKSKYVSHLLTLEYCDLLPEYEEWREKQGVGTDE